MAKVYEFLANGTEEVEALITVDILRRGGVDVKMVSTTGSEYIESSHGIVIKCDQMIENSDFSDADMLLLPGGQPGTTNLMAHEGVRKAISAHYAAGKKVGAICAAPMILGDLGILKGKKATCYPGCENGMIGAEYTHELYTIDGNIITGEGPAATFPYAYAILEMLADKQTAERLKEGMIFNHLMGK